jgi:hypothetical protein
VSGLLLPFTQTTIKLNLARPGKVVWAFFGFPLKEIREMKRKNLVDLLIVSLSTLTIIGRGCTEEFH